MYEFETFVYLDVQKTASTFIASVLEQYCTEGVINKVRHGGLKKNYRRSKFHFISVRDPLDQYLSLYSFGCRGEGQMFGLMNERGKGELYDYTWGGFEYWLEYVLDPENKSLFEKEYRSAASWMGFQSYRVMRLCVPDYSTAANARHSKSELRRLYEETNVVDFVIRYESLQDDLCDLLATALDYCVRVPEAVEYVRNAPPLNTSARIDHHLDDLKLRPRIRRILDDREWLLGDFFG